VPELPEVEALTRFLDGRIGGRIVERCELAAFAALKTVEPPLSSLVGRRARSCIRRGKYLCFELDDRWLVVHLARGGWIRWRDPLPPERGRPGRGPLALRVGFAPGAGEGVSPTGSDGEAPVGFDVTEAGTEKRLALWVVARPEEVEGLRTLGVEPLDPAFDVDCLARLMAGAAGNVKTVLASQSVIAGIGNAYSDEILHLARLSPYKPARTLTPDEVARLHGAVVSTLTDAVSRAVGQDAAALKGDKKRAMRVHGRTGQACPECGDVVREVSFATKSLQYCATCQTAGKPLADRRLSRLLK